MSTKKAALEGWGILKYTFQEFSKDECPRKAAALSYYTIFSLPPLLVLIIIIAEFTQVWAQRHGKGIQPETGAMRVIKQEKIIRDPAQQTLATPMAQK